MATVADVVLVARRCRVSPRLQHDFGAFLGVDACIGGRFGDQSIRVSAALPRGPPRIACGMRYHQQRIGPGPKV